jgi:hypothetical protein
MTQMLNVSGVQSFLGPFANVSLHALYGWTVRCLQVVVAAGVADALGDEPETAAALARKTGCNADALERMLRLLASVEIFERVPDGRYAHNPSSRCCQGANPMTAAAMIRMQGMPLFFGAMANLAHTLRTGEPSIGSFAPDGMWAYLDAHPEEACLFDATMTYQSQVTSIAVLSVYDFCRFRRVADIGGGQGGLLKAILEAAPNAKGVLFDLPKVVAGVLEGARMRVVAGSFLDEVPPDCDLYILKFILHDWPDDKARTILANVRKAAPAGAKLLVVESLRSDTPDFEPSKLMDVSMLALFGGRERTPGDFETLFAQAGFKLLRVIGSNNPMVSIVEAEAC